MLIVSLQLPEVLKTEEASILNFSEWKDFYKYYYKNCETEERKFTMVISNLSIRTRTAGSVVKCAKDDGYWIVELSERN